MTCTSIAKSVAKVSAKSILSSRLVVLLLVAMFASVLPARAQSSDTWKSVAIIGGSTAAGAYIGHRIAGPTGAYVGAAVGASAGYAIDRRRRENEYNNGYYGDNSGYYPNGGGYYGNNYPQSGDGGYYGGSPDAYPGPAGYQRYATSGRNSR